MSKKEIQAMETQHAVHEIFGQFRYLKTDDGEIWFVAVDICKILGIKNVARTLSRLKKNEKGIHTVNTLGGLEGKIKSAVSIFEIRIRKIG